MHKYRRTYMHTHILTEIHTYIHTYIQAYVHVKCNFDTGSTSSNTRMYTYICTQSYTVGQ